METRLKFEKEVPEVGDLLVGVPHRIQAEILSVVKESERPNVTLYHLKCKTKDGIREMTVPDFHFNWLGDHWILSSHPYRIEVEKPLRMDWFVTDPENQSTRSFVAPTAAAAVAMQREVSNTSPDSVFAGQLHSMSVKIDGAKILNQLLGDLERRHHPASPFHGLDCSDGTRAQLKAQMSWMSESRIAKFSKAVEDAFNELTCGHGFWWMVEGRSSPHCSECFYHICDCACPHGSNDRDTSE